MCISCCDGKEEPVSYQYCPNGFDKRPCEVLTNVILGTDEQTKDLIAVLNPNLIRMQCTCISHCNQEGVELVPYKKQTIFDFEKLYDTLNTEDGITFDPNEAKLSFGSDPGKIVIVTIKSRVANKLFNTMVQYPLDNRFEPLDFEWRKSKSKHSVSID